MTKEEMIKKIEEAVDALLLAKNHLVSDEYVFEVEQYLDEAKDVTYELYNEVYTLANKQEKELGEKEMARGYEVVKDNG